MRAVAMPAQGQKSWDALSSWGSRQRSWPCRNACPGAEILGRKSPTGTTRSGSCRNACPGAEILGLSRPNVAPTRRRLKSRNACPGAEILGPDQGQCCGCGGQFVTTPAQGQKSWDMYFHSPSVVMRSVTMPAQGQKSWDLGAVGAIAFGRDVAMPAQGQKSWD